jgi:hypothetical protein
MANWKGSCRRRPDDPRHPVYVPAAIDATVSGVPPYLGRIVTLSRGGLSFQLSRRLAPGTPVRITLYLHGRSSLTCAGQVAWAGRPKRALQMGYRSIGVSFDGELNGDFVAAIVTEEQFPSRGQMPNVSVESH